MTSLQLRSLFVAATLSMGACLDLTPTVVVEVANDAAPGTGEECLRCLTGPSGPSGPTAGCAQELADCEKIPICMRGVECTFRQGCYDIDDWKTSSICVRYCADLVKFMTVESPETTLALAFHNCATTKCQVECRGGDGGQYPSDASLPDSGAADASSDVRGTACQNEEDRMVQASSAFDSATRDCGFMCFGDPHPNCAALCMQSKGLTEACANCFGDTINCGTKNCLSECFEQTSAGCLACNEMYCNPAFRACSGN